MCVPVFVCVCVCVCVVFVWEQKVIFELCSSCVSFIISSHVLCDQILVTLQMKAALT